MKKYILYLALVPFLFCCFTGSKAPAKIYSREILKSDLAEIKSILISEHPAPYQFTGKVAFEKLYEEQMQKINRSMNAGEYFLIAAPLVEAIHCGHTWISMPDDFWNNEENLFFPTGLIFSGNKAYSALSGNNQDVAAGSEIISINKIPISDIIESTKRLVNSDAKSKTGKLAIFGYSFPDLFVLQYGNSERYETNFIPPGTTEIRTVTLKPVTREKAWENPVNTLAGSFSGGRELKLEIVQAENLAVLDIPTFGYYNNKEKFYTFIDSAFEQIHRAGIKNLILDLRNNSGGDPWCAAHLLSYLETKPAPYFAHVYEGYESLAKPIPVAEKNSFPGDLRVLINGGSFSTTGHLCALLKYAGRCKFIGEETGGTYECNDAHERKKTSAMKMNLNVARMTYTTAVKGISRETGIVPDYPVDPTINDFLSGNDAVKDFAIKLSESR